MNGRAPPFAATLLAAFVTATSGADGEAPPLRVASTGATSAFDTEFAVDAAGLPGYQPQAFGSCERHEGEDYARR